MISVKHLKPKFLLIAAAILITSCNSGTKSTDVTQNDSVKITPKDISVVTSNQQDSISNPTDSKNSESTVKTEQSKVLIYNFHVTNSCVSCIAIEEATTKTLNTYFSKEVKEGRIKRQVLNVDDEANKTISEKYQAFGSGLFITRVFKGKETTIDLTGDGFKFAKNKEEKFIEILKTTITNYLK